MSHANHDGADRRINPLSVLAVPLPGPERDAYLSGIADAILPDEARRDYFGHMAHGVVSDLLHAAVAKANDRRDLSGMPKRVIPEASIGLVAEWLEQSARPERGRDSLARSAMDATNGRSPSVITFASMGEREASGVMREALIALWRAEDAFGAVGPA